MKLNRLILLKWFPFGHFSVWWFSVELNPDDSRQVQELFCKFHLLIICIFYCNFSFFQLSALVYLKCISLLGDMMSTVVLALHHFSTTALSHSPDSFIMVRCFQHTKLSVFFFVRFSLCTKSDIAY